VEAEAVAVVAAAGEVVAPRRSAVAG